MIGFKGISLRQIGSRDQRCFYGNLGLLFGRHDETVNCCRSVLNEVVLRAGSLERWLHHRRINIAPGSLRNWAAYIREQSGLFMPDIEMTVKSVVELRTTKATWNKHF